MDVTWTILARFLAEWPDIRVDVSIEEALTSVVAEGFDAGLRLDHTLDREMIAMRVSVDQRVVVVGSVLEKSSCLFYHVDAPRVRRTFESPTMR